MILTKPHIIMSEKSNLCSIFEDGKSLGQFVNVLSLINKMKELEKDSKEAPHTIATKAIFQLMRQNKL